MYKMMVPLEAQQKSSTCWHASAFMIWRYWQQITGRQGPMNTLGHKWVKNEPVSPQDFITLAQKVGLKPLPAAYNQTSACLEKLLRTYGPIWCAGYWYGPGHVIVLTGVDGAKVDLNDPDGGMRKIGTLGWFNSRLSSHLAGCMMIKDQARY